jgi:2-polyprenyl-6-hydroxyphenyl methylase/3-demethylubiquinone-9 3-methyltransferase
VRNPDGPSPPGGSSTGGRFEFGRNWKAFLSTVDEGRIGEAEASLREMLECSDLRGKSFLDAGSGSGLFSLAARRLGARVHSFDVDPESVACTKELRERFSASDSRWSIEKGSVLDRDYLKSLGTFDVVYSWGVLHHTGDMWRALESISIPVAAGGQLFVAIYNDQGALSSLWKRVKAAYCSGRPGKWAVSAAFIPLLALKSLAAGTVRYGNPFGQMKNYRQERGMSLYHDWIDWLGGYPFEAARPDEVRRFCEKAGFELSKMVTTKGWGCNQFVFRRTG